MFVGSTTLPGLPAGIYLVGIAPDASSLWAGDAWAVVGSFTVPNYIPQLIIERVMFKGDTSHVGYRMRLPGGGASVVITDTNRVVLNNCSISFILRNIASKSVLAEEGFVFERLTSGYSRDTLQCYDIPVDGTVYLEVLFLSDSATSVIGNYRSRDVQRFVAQK